MRFGERAQGCLAAELIRPGWCNATLPKDEFLRALRVFCCLRNERYPLAPERDSGQMDTDVEEIASEDGTTGAKAGSSDDFFAWGI